MEEEYFKATIAMLILAIIGSLFIFAGILSSGNKVTSKKPIVPEYRIEVINGVADTTYIYRQSRSK